MYAIEIFYSEEDEGFIAIVPELPGCSAFGETEERLCRRSKLPCGFGWKQQTISAEPFLFLRSKASLQVLHRIEICHLNNNVLHCY